MTLADIMCGVCCNQRAQKLCKRCPAPGKFCLMCWANTHAKLDHGQPKTLCADCFNEPAAVECDTCTGKICKKCIAAHMIACVSSSSDDDACVSVHYVLLVINRLPLPTYYKTSDSCRSVSGDESGQRSGSLPPLCDSGSVDELLARRPGSGTKRRKCRLSESTSDDDGPLAKGPGLTGALIPKRCVGIHSYTGPTNAREPPVSRSCFAVACFG